MKRLLNIVLIAFIFACFQSVVIAQENESDSNNEILQPKVENNKKLDLKAVVFDPDADFTQEAKAQNREMTKMELWQEDVHDALYGEVTAIETKPLLKKYLTKDFEKGPLSTITTWTYYKGSLQNIWLGENYQNTLYAQAPFTVVEGKFKNPKFGFRTMLLWSKGKDGHDFFNDVWGDQYITYNWSKNDKVLAGYARNDVGIEGALAPTVLPFYNRSQIANAYGDARSLGVKVQGNHKFCDYSVGMFSAGRFFKDWFPGPEFVGSIGVKPLAFWDGKYGNLLVGGGLNAGNAELGRYTVGSAYADYVYKRLNLTFEYGVADGSNGSVGYTPNKSQGYNMTAAYRLTQKIQTLFRYDYFDPNTDKSNNIRNEYTVGLNYFIKGQALKLIFNYTMYNIQNGVYGSRIYTGTQIIL